MYQMQKFSILLIYLNFVLLKGFTIAPEKDSKITEGLISIEEKFTTDETLDTSTVSTDTPKGNTK